MATRTVETTMYKTQKTEQHEPSWNPRVTHVVRKGKQFLLHMWHLSCYSSYKPGDKSWMRKWPDYNYDKQNISMVICDTDIP